MKGYRTSYMIMKQKEYRKILQRQLIRMFKLNSLKKKFFKKKEWKKKKFSRKQYIKKMILIQTAVKNKLNILTCKKKE